MNLFPGDVFADRFTVVRLVGEGGMGLVYEVTDRRFADRHRALKVLRPGRAHDARARALFAREVVATAAIESAYVVSVIDYDLEAEHPWMLMELLVGMALDAYVMRYGPLRWDEARQYISELGHALGAAHRRGVLHLDLKPGNLFLARNEDLEGRPHLKLLDFGLSRQVVEGRQRVAQSRAMGTEAWMPPEQFHRGAELDATSDVWPLGLVVFWMLTGQPYWRAVDTDGDVEDFPALLREITEEPLVPATVRAVDRGVTAPLPEGFDAWLACCLARRPADRWRNGEVASEALDALLARAAEDTAPDARWPFAALGACAGAGGRIGDRAGARGPSTASVDTSVRSLSRVMGEGRWRGSFLGAAALFAAGGVGLFAMAQQAEPPPTPAADLPLAASTAAQPTAVPSRCPPDMTGFDVPRGPAVLRAGARCADRAAVSVGAWRRCVHAGVCAPTSALPGLCDSPRGDTDVMPAVCVEATQRAAYCAWASHPGGPRRLPLDAEARALDSGASRAVADLAQGWRCVRDALR